MQWWILGFAILSEVSATLCLKIAVSQLIARKYLRLNEL